jgi:hypothetical protein
MENARTRSLIERMIAAAKLDIHLYEEVEADADATSQAALVVGLVAVASAIGGAGAGAPGFFGGLIAAFIGWLAWSGITYLIGDKLLGGTATWGELLRTIGFAQSPGVLYVLAIVPVVGGLVRLAVLARLQHRQGDPHGAARLAGDGTSVHASALARHDGRLRRVNERRVAPMGRSVPWRNGSDEHFRLSARPRSPSRSATAEGASARWPESWTSRRQRFSCWEERRDETTNVGFHREDNDGLRDLLSWFLWSRSLHREIIGNSEDAHPYWA